MTCSTPYMNFVVPDQMYNARRFNTGLTPFSKMTAMADRAGALPPFQEAVPPKI